MSIEPRTVLVTNSGEMLTPGIERLRDRGVDVTILPDASTASDVVEAAQDSSVIIDSTVPLARTDIERLRSTRLIVRAGIGYDFIDVEAATEKRIWVANVPDYCIDEVADHTLLLLLACSRRLDDLADGWRHEKRWLRYDTLPEVHRIAGQVLGVVGMGRIGRQVAARARSFGWRIIAHDSGVDAETLRQHGAEPVGLDQMFAQADAITLHCPLTADTRHLVNETRLALAKPGIVIVNTSRGGLVDVDALQAGIQKGSVSAAGIDVLEDEPEPDLSRQIFDDPRVLFTSHVAWYSVESQRALATLAADEAVRVLDGGQPRNAVNRLNPHP